jgi:hypothetical protein
MTIVFRELKNLGNEKNKCGANPNRANIFAFRNWMVNIDGMSQNTANTYASGINSIAKAMVKIGITDADIGFSHDMEEISAFFNSFKDTNEFQRLNQQIGGLGTKFRKYTAFLTYHSKQEAPATPTLDPVIVKKLSAVILVHFANGYKMDSPIALRRFRAFAIEDLGEELTMADDELKLYIAAAGTTFEGKVYAVSPGTKERIREMVRAYYLDGAQAIFFAEFYARNENWLFEASVVSADMLIVILHRLFPELLFTKTYFGHARETVFSALESEILRVWGDDVLLTYGQLAERLQYIPLDRIKNALGQNGDFIWSSVETFSHISRIDISETEREAICKVVEQECDANGYTSISDLPFGEIIERNYELSLTAIHSAVFRICLSGKFDKHGKIITRKGDMLDAVAIMKDYCRTIDKCTLDDLLNYEKELTGEVHRWIPMEAGSSALIRIDKDIYVADKYAHFNSDAIDDAISLFVKHDYLPLKSFTTFSAFPDCGQHWNLFLLESYCRKFSKRFRFDAPAVNSRNAGAVIRVGCLLNYTDIMTDAVANSDIHLADNIVSKFLSESGYTGRRSSSGKAAEIIAKAKMLREMGISNCTHIHMT